jgi:alpha-ketoglutarate-dependent 2,4-dichlorophenoxyacetate dioxygenase
MPINVTPLHPHIGAEVRGADLSKPVSSDLLADIEAASNRHAVLVFPDQSLTDEQHLEFSRLLGPLEAIPKYVRGERHRLRAPEMTDVSNLDEKGHILPLDDSRRTYNLGNQLWHTDSSFKPVPAKYSLLLAREITPTGGETEFADMRAAYDALPDERKRQLEGLVVEHSIFRSRSQIGFRDFNEEVFKGLPPVQQVLVRRHSGSGRKTLYLASHASHVIGWPIEAGRQLIEELIEFATQPQFVYQHHWRVGDLVMWDNRCTMHRGRPYDEAKYRRVMHRSTISDVANTVEQEEAFQSRRRTLQDGPS